MDREVIVRIENRGWYPLAENGFDWVLQDATGEMVGRCYYTYIKYNGVEKWQGVFYQKQSDFMGNPYFSQKADGLHECVDWVEQMALGGYYS